MKLAIPIFRDEVSPRFGCSARFLVALVEENQVQSRTEEDVSHLAPWQFPDFLASLGVSQVICGGVNQRFQVEMERLGMEVIWGVIGPAEKALAAFLDGTLKRDQFVCGGPRGRRGRGQGRSQSGGGPQASPGRGRRRGGRGNSNG